MEEPLSPTACTFVMFQTQSLAKKSFSIVMPSIRPYLARTCQILDVDPGDLPRVRWLFPSGIAGFTVNKRSSLRTLSHLIR